MTRPFFNQDNPTDEANHWLSLLLHKAIRSIDEQLGQGYAKQNPQLIGSYLQAGATLMGTNELGSDISRLGGSISEISMSLDRISDNIPAFPVED